MDARQAWKTISGNRRNGNRLKRLRAEFFERPLREVRALRQAHLERRSRTGDDLCGRLSRLLGSMREDGSPWLLEHWQREIAGYLDGLRRIDEGIARCEERVAHAWKYLH